MSVIQCNTHLSHLIDGFYTLIYIVIRLIMSCMFSISAQKHGLKSQFFISFRWVKAAPVSLFMADLLLHLVAGEMPDIWLEKYRPIKFEARLCRLCHFSLAPDFCFLIPPRCFFPTVHSTAQDVVGNTGAVTILRSHAAAGAVRVESYPLSVLLRLHQQMEIHSRHYLRYMKNY